MTSPLPALESAWQTLRSTLEWAEEFGLMFIFCSDVRAKEQLFQRANDLMHVQVRPFQRPVASQSTTLIEQFLPLAVNPATAHASLGMPLWLDLDHHPDDPAWDHARQEFLQRLNERRAAMAREHNRTVVLVLPLDWTKRAAEAAPDLWTIRQPSVYLDTRQDTPTAHTDTEITEQRQTFIAPQSKLPDTVLRWLAAHKSEQTPISAWSAAHAIEAAMSAGHTELAWKIAQTSVATIKDKIKGSEKTPERLRDLSILMGNLGNVAQALGQLDKAQQAYQESETLLRSLISDFGKTPERLRDLSVSISKLGDVAQALGQLDKAQQAYQESEMFDRSLINDFGQTPERLRDLAVSIERLGDVALALGQLDKATQAYEAEIQLATDLIERYGETASALEVLAFGEMHLGLTFEAQKKTTEANVHLSKASRLYQRLALAFPHNHRYMSAIKKFPAVPPSMPSQNN